MKYLILLPVLFGLGACNAAYIKAVNEQRAAGYVWVQIPCRVANPDHLAITIDSPNGKSLVCNELRKPTKMQVAQNNSRQ